MRFLGVTETCDLGSLCMHLARRRRVRHPGVPAQPIA